MSYLVQTSVAQLSVNHEVSLATIDPRQARVSPKRICTCLPEAHGIRGNTMQTKRIYQVQHWPDGRWDRQHNWQKIEAGSEKEAAEKVCGFALAQTGMLGQLRARVLRLGDLRQRSATEFYAGR